MPEAAIVALACLAFLVGLPIAGSLCFLAVFLPLTLVGRKYLPPFAPTSVDGVSTIAEAIEACRRLTGTEAERAAYARSLVARKMAYSRRNPWDDPSRCFERGYGYCVQQALALERIYRGAGIECRPVQALRCRFPAGTVHGRAVPVRVSGHMWLQARLDGEFLDVDPARADLEPGRLGFEVLSRVSSPPRALIAVMHVFSAAENARRDAPALLGRRREP